MHLQMCLLMLGSHFKIKYLFWCKMTEKNAWGVIGKALYPDNKTLAEQFEEAFKQAKPKSLSEQLFQVSPQEKPTMNQPSATERPQGATPRYKHKLTHELVDDLADRSYSHEKKIEDHEKRLKALEKQPPEIGVKNLASIIPKCWESYRQGLITSAAILFAILLLIIKMI